MPLTRGLLIGILALACGGLSLDAQGRRTDWPQWRGPNRDGAATSFTAPKTWPDRLVRKWKVDVGLGYATPLVVGNRVYVFSRQGDREVMSALDATSGKVLWSTGYPAEVVMVSGGKAHGPGPKSTPVFSDGRLYAMGMTGVVTAYDAGTGKQLWQTPKSDVLPKYESPAFSPIVDRGLVVFHVGGHDKGALTAFDAKTGEVRWSWAGDGPGYGSPVMATFGGTRQIVTITQGKLVGVEVATGALLWEREFRSPRTNNAVTPVVSGRSVMVSHADSPAIAWNVERRDAGWIVERRWENTDAPFNLSNAVAAGGVLFGLSYKNSGQYFAVDVSTGRTLWTSPGRQATNAAIAAAGDVFLSLENDGELVVARASRTGFEPLRRYKVANDETWTQAAYSGDRIFVKDVSSLTLWTLK